jgi:hypothetical protein
MTDWFARPVLHVTDVEASLYRLLVVDDPDGNQLFFPYPNETASGKTVRSAEQ